MPLPAHTPELSTLVVLTAVAGAGSMSAAARELNMSQQAVSSRVHTAERELGVAVFHRTSQGVSPTANGTLIIEWATDILTAAERFSIGVRGLRSRRRTSLRVASSMTVAEYLLPGWVVALRAAQPALHVSIRPANTADVLAAVKAGHADLGFVEGSGGTDGLASVPIGDDDLAVVVPPSHPWSRRDTVDPDEVARTALVQREHGSGTAQVFRDALARVGLHPCEPLLELGSVSAVKAAINSAGAPAVLSMLSVAEEMRRGALVRVTVTGLSFPRKLRAVWDKNTGLHGSASDLVSHAQREMHTRIRPSPDGR